MSWELPAPRDAALTVGGRRGRRGTLPTPQLRGHRWLVCVACFGLRLSLFHVTRCYSSLKHVRLWFPNGGALTC